MAAIGPAVIGAVIGLPGGPFSAAHEAVSIPALVFGVTLLMVPALYVATSMIGLAPAAQRFGRAVGAGLRATGISMLGFAAPAAFLIATSTGSSGLPHVIGGAVLCGSILIGLRALYRTLFPDRAAAKQVVVYIAWSCLALVIGMLFYARGIEL